MSIGAVCAILLDIFQCVFFVFNVKYVSVLGPKLSPKIRAKNGLFWVLIWPKLKPYRFTHLCLFVLKRS